MKLAFCLYKYYPFGGLERDFLRTAKYCADCGHEIHIYTMDWQGAVPTEFQLHLLKKSGFSNSRQAVNFSKQLQALLPQEKYDVVIGFNRIPEVDLYYAADLCFAKNAMEKHRAWFKLTSRYNHYLSLEKRLFSPENHTKILALTKNEINNYRKYYNTQAERFLLIPPGIKNMGLDFETWKSQRNEFRKKFKISDDGIFLLQIGSDFTRKGVDRSILAIADLPDHIKQKLVFWIIGHGKKQCLEELIQKHKLEKQIKLVGGRNDIKDIMLAADLLLHPARFETAGMVLVEAITCGLPVLVSENSGYAFHIQESGAGEIIPFPFNQKAFNQQLSERLKNNNHIAETKHALAYAKNTDLYSMIEKIETLIRNYAQEL